ncbi:MAG: hypothetical protein II507_10790, partial [Treponema sp.]|nr:hypothetical protein [Treponema sp.]
LCIDLFEVNKEFRNIGLGTLALERLMLETGAKKIVLDAKDTNAEIFWQRVGLTKVDNQTYTIM